MMCSFYERSLERKHVTHSINWIITRVNARGIAGERVNDVGVHEFV